MKMKGVMKGIKYISHIFEGEKQPEIQIGLPTDVKHIAHIGFDGGNANKPSWMNEFKSSEFPSATSSFRDDDADPVTKMAVTGPLGFPMEFAERRCSAKSKKPKRTNSIGSVRSLGPDSLGTNKPRKFKNSGTGYDPMTRDPAKFLSTGSDSPKQVSPRVSKRCARKKAKDASSRRSRPEGQDSSSKNRPASGDESGHGSMNSTNDPNAVLRIYEE